jgi:hypothetical protein
MSVSQRKLRRTAPDVSWQRGGSSYTSHRAVMDEGWNGGNSPGNHLEWLKLPEAEGVEEVVPGEIRKRPRDPLTRRVRPYCFIRKNVV